jgi:4-amino-4-deoxy-L-arabinose transferase-like glycosyltransferase
MCALIAFLNACAWSLIIPPFQGRDEVDHFAYVAQIAETGALPANGQAEGVYSPQQKLLLQGLHYYPVRFSPAEPTISTQAEQQIFEEDLHAHASTIGSGEAGVATPEPPLFYAMQTIPYFLAQGNMLDQLQLMRLVGALLGAVTAVLCFLFVREAVPGVRWAATVGGICVALQPLFGFMSSCVNPDVLMFTIGAAIFLCLLRAFRSGLSWRSALVLGLLTAAGFLTKLNFIGFGIGVFFGMCALAVRGVRSRGRRALLPVSLATAIGFAPPAIYVLINKLSGERSFGPTSENVEGLSVEQVFHELSYVWELYLPRLPGMPHYFRGLSTTMDVWFDRSVGFYGWMDVYFPTWVNTLALFFAIPIALLCCRELFARRAAVRARLPELATYAAITVGVLLVIGVPSYHTDILGHIYGFGEPRYLLPMLALLGAAIALAVRGGRRWGPQLGAAMIVLFLAHDIFSQLQAIARYYS